MAGETFTQEQVDALVAERLTAEVAGLKANQAEALKEAKAAKAKLAVFEGIDPVEHKTLKEAAAEAERKKALAEGNLEVWKKQVTDAHTKERESDAKGLQKRDRALEKYLVEAKLAAALAKADADPTMTALLMLEGKRFVRVRETDEDFEDYVADEKGNQLVADGKGTPMDVDTFVAQTLKQKYPAAFRGSGSSGGGAPKSNGGAGGAKTIAAGDNAAFLANLDAIADGTVQVQ